MSSHEIESIDDLKDFLYLAMKIEHSTIPPYLTALYSLKLEFNDEVRNILRTVVVEEMLHLSFAANLLNAIGGHPDLTQRDFVTPYPTPLPGGLDDFEIHLGRFGHDALDTFLKIERPNMAPSQDLRVVPRRYRAGPHLLGVNPRKTDERFYSIGEFYAAVERGFTRLENNAVRRGTTIFKGDPSRQLERQYFYSGGGRLFPVTNISTACSAIQKVIEQGEGETRKIRDEQGELAHYYRFDQICKGAFYEKTDPPEHPTGIKFEVDWNQVYPIKQDLTLADFPAGSELRRKAIAFNVAYRNFLRVLTEAFNGTPSRLDDAVKVMFSIRNVLTDLIHVPLPGRAEHAGPTFELYAQEVVEAAGR